MTNGITVSEETEQKLRMELAHARQRLVEAHNEAWIHRQNYNAALAILSIFAPPDVTECLNDKLTRDWIESTK